MEEYMNNMKTLRFQMNDVEEQVAQISVEEHMFIATVQTLQKDLNLAKEEVQLIKEEANEMMKVKGQICTQILEKQRKIASLESDSTTLNQSLELIYQERESMSEKLENRRMNYSKVTEEIKSQLKEQQAWVNARICSPNEKLSVLKLGTEEVVDKPYEAKACDLSDFENDMLTSLKDKVDAAKFKLDHLKEQKTKLVADCNEAKKLIEQMNRRISEFKPELKEMGAKALEEEFQALLSDKNGETEYLQSLQLQISKLKDISNLVKCPCGEEFKVDMRDVWEKIK
ncbi:actin binding motor protein [Lithospermum erythrorhizon]|uniref:Actin binding motor protein n=1 Tax=Lithospermum erythrorhizon TaxID=34254 RepID=A0AAV3RXF2_LITER